MSFCAIRRGPMGGDQYTQIHNHVFRDTRLTPTAVTVFGYLSTHTQGWETSVAGIARDRQLGPAAVKAALAVLKQYHYVVWGQERNDDGTVGKGWYFITDLPAQLASLGIENDKQVKDAVGEALYAWMEENRRSEPVSPERHRLPPAETRPQRVFPKSCLKENRRSEPVSEQTPSSQPVSAQPLADGTASGQTRYKEEHLLREDHSKKENQRTTLALARSTAAEPPDDDVALFASPALPSKRPTNAELMAGFDEFYAAYPLHKGKQDAQKAWLQTRRKGVEVEHLILAAKRYAMETADRDPGMKKYPAGWLRDGYYDDEPDDRRVVQMRSPLERKLSSTEALREQMRAMDAADEVRQITRTTPRAVGGTS